MIDLSKIPPLSGVYIIKDRFGRIIYIGKAKNLRKRVSSYFSKKADTNYKTKNIKFFAFSIDFIISDGEREALIIERRLIAIHKPIFNVMWKDSKSYPFVVITKEDFPRLIITRKKNLVGSYYGPYPHIEIVKKLIEKLTNIGFINLRKCKYNFSLSNPLDIKKRQRCIYYHTKQCPAPCDGSRISFNDYKKNVLRVKKFFSFKHSSLIKEFEKEMKKHSENLEFEKAKEYRDFIEAINHIYERVSINETSIEDIERKYDFTKLLVSLKEKLFLKNIPYHIESFDVSNIMNKYICGVSVCFLNGVKNHEHYKKFKARFVPQKHGGNDYAVMEEIVSRRYKSKEDLPHLIIIDGGKGQLEAANKALSKIGFDNCDLIAIAKENELIYKLDMKEPIRLDKNSGELLFLTSIRDETHRFAISYHRKLRDLNLFI